MTDISIILLNAFYFQSFCNLESPQFQWFQIKEVILYLWFTVKCSLSAYCISFVIYPLYWNLWSFHLQDKTPTATFFSLAGMKVLAVRYWVAARKHLCVSWHKPSNTHRRRWGGGGHTLQFIFFWWIDIPYTSTILLGPVIFPSSFGITNLQISKY